MEFHYASALGLQAIAFGAAIIAVPLIEAPQLLLLLFSRNCSVVYVYGGWFGPCLQHAALGCIN